MDHPQYTRPAEVEGLQVPAVLLSGDHAAIERWRRKESLRLTAERRPDLLRSADLDARDRSLLEEIAVEGTRSGEGTDDEGA